MGNLFQAAKQWSTRPADQRFWTIEEMAQAVREHKESARQALVKNNTLRIAATDNDNLAIVGEAGIPATLTNWSFNQLCNRLGAPAGYLAKLPRELVSANLEHGLRNDNEGETNLLIHRNGSTVCRALTSDQYARIWNYDICETLQRAAQSGWRVPPARPAGKENEVTRIATEADCVRSGHPVLGIKPGDLIAPAGLYASDHDMFAFMVNDENRLNDGSEGGLSRGFFVSNSEVGANALKIVKFLYRHVCGNHIVWDASEVEELRIVHRGENDLRYESRMIRSMREYANSSAIADQSRIDSARRLEIADSRDKVINTIFASRVLSKAVAESAYNRAEQDNENPRSKWGFVQGVTALSQETQFADKRNELDRAAGKILSMAF